MEVSLGSSASTEGIDNHRLVNSSSKLCCLGLWVAIFSLSSSPPWVGRHGETCLMRFAGTSFCSPSTLLVKRVPVSVKSPVPRLRCRFGWRANVILVLRNVFEDAIFAAVRRCRASEFSIVCAPDCSRSQDDLNSKEISLMATRGASLAFPSATETSEVRFACNSDHLRCVSTEVNLLDGADKMVTSASISPVCPCHGSRHWSWSLPRL